LKICIVDADVIIHLLEENLLYHLAKLGIIQVATTVIGEVDGYTDPISLDWVPVDFRKAFVESGVVTEVSASSDDVAAVLVRMPKMGKGLDPGETESLAIVLRYEDVLFCSCDVAAIHALPYIDAAERGVSIEGAFRAFGGAIPKGSKLSIKFKEEYFQSNLRTARAKYVQNPPK